MSRYRLERDKTALLVVDIQERLLAAMQPAAAERLLNRTIAAIKGALALGLPVIATEQYPKGLGPTVAPIRQVLASAPIEKVRFTAALPEVLQALTGRPQVLITGMETHVCVFQTVRDLADKASIPYLCVDAVLSRTEEDKRVGLELCKEVGAVATTVESALFDLLGVAGTPEFKQVSAAVK
jgi:nicotinamidase-related amidase